ncbi:tRNA lysidine(34) synthetase TilS [Cocleimonas sp. KMM 6892]|uniref:tRNA lysidine(34) synthetase TilS n=1 Tax=unclassified Cocleimonas TaxID=2639732 RepID=UPI002DB72A93|nr:MULTISPECIES: tRNA lysidine(34) synthetase TilS [unclassified Cocleimonas]MEB8432908.1 tRNA lysidine(34) synthetase TilS [Cocleimonas sp. KMM 6892]MEC4716111.1 tRNA lysidine(34) synthetase TilS [Cocleimonas sp. KMM 6895]MEC4745572.1 tRNA lysidine(34) synthetase TilS [Cocleimonas sp. KMM 6896]
MISVSEIYRQLRMLAPEKTFVIAYSGGLDSHVLLHLLSQIPNAQSQVRAIHIDHGLQLASQSWASHCETVCRALGIPFAQISLKLSVQKGQSVEEVARIARYEALHQSLGKNESLLTAHHQNDQTETFLLNLFRGAGVDGLASMPISRLFGPAGSERQLLRPLLSCRRSTLESYAKQHQLNVIEDPSNLDESFDRNYLRQRILPELANRWPGIDKSISRSAAIQAEAKEILNEIADVTLKHVCDFNKNALSIDKLQKLSKAKQKLVLRYWIAENGFSYPSENKLQHLFSDVIEANHDTQPLLEWQGVQLRRFQNYLYISQPLINHDPSIVIKWDLSAPLVIDSLNLTIQPDELSGVIPEDTSCVTVKFRQGGEKIRIPNRGNLSVKNLYQEEGVPPWMRDRMPFIYIEDELYKIIGLALK